MFRAASLLTTLLLALSIVATPVEVRTPRVTLPLAKRINANGGAINLVQLDQARAAALKGRGAAIQSGQIDRRDVISVPATNEAVHYIASVRVGSPATAYNLIIDTGSSNTWVGAGTPYTPTSTSTDTGEPVSHSYGSGSFSGEEYTDTVDLGSGLVITQQSIGVASTSTGFSNVDGILGIGPVDLTQGTLTNQPSAVIPTVTDNLFTQGTISENVVGVSFEPITSEPSTNGELTFGGVDSSKYTGDITYTPVTTTSPATFYWGINESVTYGSTTILAETAGIVDTGTTLILLASDAYSAYQSVTGATPDSATNLLKLTPDQYNSLESLFFYIGGTKFELTPNGQIWPRSLNSYISGTSGSIYSIVNDLKTSSGQGLDFVNGQAFLERFYSVFDTGNHRVGIATTSFTDATSN